MYKISEIIMGLGVFIRTSHFDSISESGRKFLEDHVNQEALTFKITKKNVDNEINPLIKKYLDQIDAKKIEIKDISRPGTYFLTKISQSDKTLEIIRVSKFQNNFLYGDFISHTVSWDFMKTEIEDYNLGFGKVKLGGPYFYNKNVYLV